MGKENLNLIKNLLLPEEMKKILGKLLTRAERNAPIGPLKSGFVWRPIGSPSH
jgi:hypothetical protein